MTTWLQYRAVVCPAQPANAGGWQTMACAGYVTGWISISKSLRFVWELLPSSVHHVVGDLAVRDLNVTRALWLETRWLWDDSNDTKWFNSLFEIMISMRKDESTYTGDSAVDFVIQQGKCNSSSVYLYAGPKAFLVNFIITNKLKSSQTQSNSNTGFKNTQNPQSACASKSLPQSPKPTSVFESNTNINPLHPKKWPRCSQGLPML